MLFIELFGYLLLILVEAEVFVNALSPQKEVLLGVLVTLVAAFWLRWAVLNGGLRVWHLFVNGALYVTYLTVVLV